MSFEKAKEHLERFGFQEKIHMFDVSSATVELAAKALGCPEQYIAKTLSFKIDNRAVLLVVTSGDTKIDNAKYKACFGTKAKMLAFDEVEAYVGHSVGGVCPFGVNAGVEIYLDESIKRFEKTYPACGTANSAVELTIEELEKCSGYKAWIDVCKVS